MIAETSITSHAENSNTKTIFENSLELLKKFEGENYDYNLVLPGDCIIDDSNYLQYFRYNNS